MACTGSEISLRDCPHAGWKIVSSNCNGHTEDIVVQCSGYTGEYQVQLKDGGSNNSGRIEINYVGNWGPICDNGFGMEEANVICRMAGFPKGALTNKSYSKSSHMVFLKDLSCQGSETSIKNCTFNFFANYTCPSNKVAGVVCKTQGPADLSVSLMLNKRVEITYYNISKSICSDGFDAKDARVICRMKGYDDVDKVTYIGSSSLDVKAREVWILNMTCKGTETTIEQCNPIWNWENKACNSKNRAGVSCKSGIELRLVGGAHNNSGRLEIRLMDKWGTVCDKGWDINASDVACRMLKFPRALKIQKFQQGTGPISLYNISCVGCERSLDDCYHPAWGSTSPCNHSNDVGLVCLPGGPPNLSTKVMADGRIEISYYGVNRSICYDGFDEKDALVICRMNGYKDVAYITQITSQAGNSKTEEVWFLDMDCTGDEKSIERCSQSWNWENRNCPKNSNLRAGIVCKNGNESLDVEFRLEDVTTPAPYSGRLTVEYYKRWGNICAKDLKLEDAHVICRMLNFTEALTISHWGKHTGNVSFELVNHCKGTEDVMKNCTGVKLKQVHACEEGNYAGVVCTPKITVTPTPLPRNVRLSGGSDNTRGRVEVQRHNIWGTVCNSGWDMREANVVCRMKGFDSAITATKSFGEGTGPIWMSGLRCKGIENNIEGCTSDGQEKTTSCNHSMDAGVVCRRYKDDVKVSLNDPTRTYDGRLMLKVNSTDAGSICGNGWDKEDADVACQMMGFKQALVPISHFGGGSKNIGLSNVRCSNSDKSLKTCNHDGWVNNLCPKDHHAGVICERPGVNDPNFGMKLVKVLGTNLSKVEVQYYGVWGAVSFNNWNLADAHVVCWSNGSGKASRAVGVINNETLPILIDNLNCLGSENSIEECGFKWGIASPSQSKVAAVECTTVSKGDGSSMTAKITPGSGQNIRFGEVKITYKSNDYAVCGDKWDIKDADVVCTMSNYKNGAMAAIRKYAINTNNKQFLTGFQCRGTEKTLGECYRDTSLTSCPGNFIAGVMCKPDTGVPLPKMELRLANDGSATNSRRVEVSYGGEWGTLCNDGNSQQNARVICRMLGYVDVGSFRSTSKPSGQISWLGNMQCKGTEKSIEECKPKWGEATCNDDSMLSVTCEKAAAPHFQINGNDAIDDSTAKISFRNVASDLQAIYQIAVERRPYEERFQSFNTQETPFEFKIVNYTTSAKYKGDSYITAEVPSSFLHKNNITIGVLTLNQGPNKGFINEPLQPETPYRVYVRIATESYDKKTRIYGDYSYVAFKTKKVFAKGRAEKLTSSRGGGAVIGMSIVIIMLIAVIICASIWFIKKQRNEELDASDKSQGLEMTDNGDMRTVNDIPEGYYQAPLRDERNEYVTPDKDKAAYQSLVTRTRIARNKQENESPLYVEIRS